MRALSIICYCAVATAIVAFPFLLVSWVKFIKSQLIKTLTVPQFPLKPFNFFVIPLFIAIVASTIMTIYARHDALTFVRSVSGNYTLFVDDQRVRDPDKMISALRETTPYWGHHSHPTKRLRVEIQSGGKDLTMELGRDSGDPQEYWVFYTGHGLTPNNEIGRITTSVFDGY